ncbi:glutaredoxin [Obba rivulosa]|uniref:Glutaredoxin n=1 Tax=Obba rivulosa TaxID=1052685 RepID=A0A8E2DQ72_9APHY|nr:glutaredoxin [Obba rivulosa]
MNPPPTARPWAGSPYRRRRILWTLLLFSGIFFFLFKDHLPADFWSLPSSLKDFGFSPESSRAGQVALAKEKEKDAVLRVEEIQALLHFVTAHPDRTLDESEDGIRVEGIGWVKVDPQKELDLRVFAPDGDVDWEKHLKVLNEKYPLVVFSKTYCPYSQSAKTLLNSYAIHPPPFVVELNTRSDGAQMQTILSRLTQRPTVPNILLNGKSIGGSDDIHKLHETHELKPLLQEGGLEVTGGV